MFCREHLLFLGEAVSLLSKSPDCFFVFFKSSTAITIVMIFLRFKTQILRQVKQCNQGRESEDLALVCF